MRLSAARSARGQRRCGAHRLNRVAGRPLSRTPLRCGRRPGRGGRRGRAGVGVLRNAARVIPARLAGSPCSGRRNRRGPRLLRGRSLRRLGGDGSWGRRGRRRSLRRACRCRCGRGRGGLRGRGRTPRTFGARVPVGRAAGCAQGDEDQRRVQPSQSRPTGSRGSLHCAFFFACRMQSGLTVAPGPNRPAVPMSQSGGQVRDTTPQSSVRSSSMPSLRSYGSIVGPVGSGPACSSVENWGWR